MTNKEKFEAFTEELNELSKKYNIVIGVNRRPGTFTLDIIPEVDIEDFTLTVFTYSEDRTVADIDGFTIW